jgi:hypothetical protein
LNPAVKEKRQLRVLDLFSGLEGFSQAFRDRGHKVTTFDLDPDFHADWICDINELEELPKADVILASPPCNAFSVMNIAKNWTVGGRAKTEEAKQARALVLHVLSLIYDSEPRFWVMENPVGKLRKILRKPDATVTWCQYGAKVMKPTDLWGALPESFSPKACKKGSSCHVPAPRGSYTGTQNHLSPAERAKIPYGLSLELCEAMERAS